MQNQSPVCICSLTVVPGSILFWNRSACDLRCINRTCARPGLDLFPSQMPPGVVTVTGSVKQSIPLVMNITGSNTMQ